MYCTNCGKELPNNSRVCPACGEVQTAAPEENPAPQYDVISLGEWMVTILLTFIPLIGLVMMFVWGFGGSVSLTKRNWARAALIWQAIGFLLGVICFITFIAKLLG